MPGLTRSGLHKDLGHKDLALKGLGIAGVCLKCWGLRLQSLGVGAWVSSGPGRKTLDIETKPRVEGCWVWGLGFRV